MGMLKPHRRTSLSALCVNAIAFALLPGMAAWPPSLAAQTQSTGGEKLVEVQGIQSRADAVMITKVTVGDSEVQCGLVVVPNKVQPVTPFQAGSDWLQEMSISLFNRTNRKIVFADVTLEFPETGDGISWPVRVYPIQLGRLPQVAAFSGRTGQPLPQDPARKPIAFLPGPTLVIHVGDYIDGIRESLADLMPFADVSKCLIRIGPFFFEDGMRWDSGGFAVPDPERRGRFKRLDDDYFPGNMLLNWPPGYRY
jgi:hypothetical protein